MKKPVSLILAFGLFTVLLPVKNASADRRSYAWTYEYQTTPKGMTELEYYVTTEAPDTSESNINTWKHQLELEYGLTSRWDIGMYQMWKHKNTVSGSTTEYDGFKLRTKYRIGDKNQFLLDPLLYFKYIRDDDFSKPNVGEVKLVLSKDIEDFNISYNQIAERNLEKEGKTDHGYATGVSYRFSHEFKLGLESKGDYSAEKYAAGPTAAFVTKRFWVSFGAVFGLNERTDDVDTRMIVGVPF